MCHLLICESSQVYSCLQFQLVITCHLLLSIIISRFKKTKKVLWSIFKRTDTLIDWDIIKCTKKKILKLYWHVCRRITIPCRNKCTFSLSFLRILLAYTFASFKIHRSIKSCVKGTFKSVILLCNICKLTVLIRSVSLN